MPSGVAYLACAHNGRRVLRDLGAQQFVLLVELHPDQHPRVEEPEVFMRKAGLIGLGAGQQPDVLAHRDIELGTVQEILLPSDGGSSTTRTRSNRSPLDVCSRRAA